MLKIKKLIILFIPLRKFKREFLFLLKKPFNPSNREKVKMLIIPMIHNHLQSNQILQLKRNLLLRSLKFMKDLQSQKLSRSQLKIIIKFNILQSLSKKNKFESLQSLNKMDLKKLIMEKEKERNIQMFMKEVIEILLSSLKEN